MFSGIAAQFKATKLLSDRKLLACINLERTSLPVPVGPLIKTVTSFAATRFTNCRVKAVRFEPHVYVGNSSTIRSANFAPVISADISDTGTEIFTNRPPSKFSRS